MSEHEIVTQFRKEREGRARDAAPEMLAWLTHANAYLHKAVADGELEGCSYPARAAVKRIDALLARIEGKDETPA